MLSEQIIDQMSQRDQEPPTIQAMRWFFFILIFLWTLAAMVMPIVVFCITKNSLSFYLFSAMVPPIAIQMWIVKFLFRDGRDYKLAALKTLYAIEKEPQNKKQVL